MGRGRWCEGPTRRPLRTGEYRQIILYSTPNPSYPPATHTQDKKKQAKGQKSLFFSPSLVRHQHTAGICIALHRACRAVWDSTRLAAIGLCSRYDKRLRLRPPAARPRTRRRPRRAGARVDKRTNTVDCFVISMEGRAGANER